MNPPPMETRLFEAGTTGRTAADLGDWRIAQLWLQGRYEIIEALLTMLAAGYVLGGEALTRLRAVEGRVETRDGPG